MFRCHCESVIISLKKIIKKIGGWCGGERVMKGHETKPFSITQCMSNIQYEKTKLILVIFYSTNILKEKHNTQVNTCITYPIVEIH